MRMINDENKSLDCIELGSSHIGALSIDRFQILQLLSKGPMYPAEIAREMNVEIQSIYYHVRLLEKAGLVKFYDYIEVGGAAAKRYALTSSAVSVIISPSWKSFVSKKPKLRKFSR